MENRTPVPLRCHDCGEIIYSDQEYIEDFDDSGEGYDHPWHKSCADAWEAKKAADRAANREYLKGLGARPWGSLSYEEASCLSMARSADSLLDFITKDPGYFGPGRGESK